MKDGVSAKLLDPIGLLKSKLVLQFGATIGDFGCGGAGFFTLPAARIVGTKGKVYAVDILKSALEGVTSKAKLENILNIQTVWSDLEQVGATAIPEQILDRALLINILFQSRQNNNILQEIKRLLKFDGKLLVVDWRVEPTPFGPPLQNRMSSADIIKLATNLGYVLEQEFKVGLYHYGLVFIKK